MIQLSCMTVATVYVFRNREIMLFSKVLYEAIANWLSCRQPPAEIFSRENFSSHRMHPPVVAVFERK